MFYLPLSLFNFISLLNFFYSPPPPPHLFYIFFHPQIHRPPSDSTSTPHPPYIDPTSTPRRPYIDHTSTHIGPLSTTHRPHIDLTSTLHSTLFLFNTASYIVKLYTTTPHFYCFPSITTTTTTTATLNPPLRKQQPRRNPEDCKPNGD